ncbi:signal peptidase I [Streptomyces sp. NPDC050560]|uniref:signal peptidase I n=1 Tax=Streptomyces sp. NPDC050560 TaxID=3365630 RepID=UPI00379AF56F
MGERGRRRGSDPGDGSAASRPALGGRAERRRRARRVKRRRRRSALREIPLLLGIALGIALILKTFVVQAFVIPSGSMEDTIQIGDRVLVDKFTPWFGAEPHRGDVIVFRDPGHWLDAEKGTSGDAPVVIRQLKAGLAQIGLLPSDDDRDLIKRVVAVGGDTVKCCDAAGRVTVNGRPLDEPYIQRGNKPSAFPFEVHVPAGRLFVMGDHRANSADSRYHRDEGYSGTVSLDSVVGRARLIAWPFGHWSKLDEPATYASVSGASTGPGTVTGPSHRVAPADLNGLIPLPSPAEPPLVMGVVGLYRYRSRQRHGLRSGCGGCGGRRTFRARRARGAGALRLRLGHEHRGGRCDA